MHALVGSIWAIFYAYFVWSLFEYPPAVQGMIFSLLPAVLAGLIMVPQMDHMYWKLLDPKIHENGFFAIGLGWTGPFTIILGHLLYGAVMGSFYTRPVGYAVGGRAATYG